MTQSNHPVNKELSGMVMAYKPTGLIADLVAPRVNFNASVIEYRKQTLGENFRPFDTRVSRTGKAKRVEFKSKPGSMTIGDHALKDLVPVSDIQKAVKGCDPKAIAAESTKELMDLSREVTVANMFNDETNYNADNVITMTAGSQLTDASFDPIKFFRKLLSKMIVRANTAIFSADMWEEMATNSKVVSAALGNSGESGVATPERVAQLLGLDTIHIGKAFVNTAKDGQSASMDLAWGGNIIFAYIDPKPTAQTKKSTFAISPSNGLPYVREGFEEDAGADGAHLIKVVDKVESTVLCKELGILVKNAV